MSDFGETSIGRVEGSQLNCIAQLPRAVNLNVPKGGLRRLQLGNAL